MRRRRRAPRAIGKELLEDAALSRVELASELGDVDKLGVQRAGRQTGRDEILKQFAETKSREGR